MFFKCLAFFLMTRLLYEIPIAFPKDFAVMNFFTQPGYDGFVSGP